MKMLILKSALQIFPQIKLSTWAAPDYSKKTHTDKFSKFFMDFALLFLFSIVFRYLHLGILSALYLFYIILKHRKLLPLKDILQIALFGLIVLALIFPRITIKDGILDMLHTDFIKHTGVIYSLLDSTEIIPESSFSHNGQTTYYYGYHNLAAMLGKYIFGKSELTTLVLFIMAYILLIIYLRQFCENNLIIFLILLAGSYEIFYLCGHALGTITLELPAHIDGAAAAAKSARTNYLFNWILWVPHHLIAAVFSTQMLMHIIKYNRVDNCVFLFFAAIYTGSIHVYLTALMIFGIYLLIMKPSWRITPNPATITASAIIAIFTYIYMHASAGNGFHLFIPTFNHFKDIDYLNVLYIPLNLFFELGPLFFVLIYIIAGKPAEHNKINKFIKLSFLAILFVHYFVQPDSGNNDLSMRSIGIMQIILTSFLLTNFRHIFRTYKTTVLILLIPSILTVCTEYSLCWKWRFSHKIDIKTAEIIRNNEKKVILNRRITTVFPRNYYYDCSESLLFPDKFDTEFLNNRNNKSFLKNNARKYDYSYIEVHYND